MFSYVASHKIFVPIELTVTRHSKFVMKINLLQPNTNNNNWL